VNIKNNKPFAEVVASSLDTFTAQCWNWNEFPRFGSLVQTETETPILGTVVSIETGSMDPTRYPFPYKKTEAELQKEQPQIFEFLKTIFHVKILGYQDDTINYAIPPHPAKIHSFVKTSDPSLAADFFSQPDFLYLLFTSQNNTPHTDDLLIAIFQQLKAEKKLNKKTFDAFYKTFSLLTNNEYRRTKLFLKRVDKAIADK